MVISRFRLAATLWLAAPVWAVFARPAIPPNAVYLWLAATVAVGGGAIVLLGAIGRVPGWVRRYQYLLLSVALPLTVLLATAAGGLDTVAALAVVPPLAAIAWRGGVRRGLNWSMLVVSVLLLCDVMANHTPAMPQALLISGAILLGGSVPVLLARRLEAEGIRARRHLARVEGYLLDRRVTPRGSDAVPSDLRRDAEILHVQAEGMQRLEELSSFLRDVRDLMGAEEAVFWRWSEQRAAQIPFAWSTDNSDTPAYFHYDAWAPRVKWCAESEMVQCVDKDGRVTFVAAPVIASRGRLLGVLSVGGPDGLKLGREEARRWVVRHAARVATMAELTAVRSEFTREMRRSRALLRTAQRIQEHSSAEHLAEAVCYTAMDVTPADRGALIRWDSDTGWGTVIAVSAAHPIPGALRISPESFLAVQCRLGEPIQVGDARALGRRAPVYGANERDREIGALAIAPLRREGDVIGAIVVEADKPGQLEPADLRTLMLLAGLSAAPLQVAWRMEEVTQRARTDQLTGLYNRRHFDEELSRVLAAADRYGNVVSLILVDIDRFKTVNDTFGHEAGDHVLREVARVLREGVRTLDVCARYGGEEIAILLPQTAVAGAAELAERLRRAVEEHEMTLAGRQVSVTVSMGVAGYPECVRLREGLFPAADRALYQAKAAGRNVVRSAVVSYSIPAN